MLISQRRRERLAHADEYEVVPLWHRRRRYKGWQPSAYTLGVWDHVERLADDEPERWWSTTEIAAGLRERPTDTGRALAALAKRLILERTGDRKNPRWRLAREDEPAVHQVELPRRKRQPRSFAPSGAAAVPQARSHPWAGPHPNSTARRVPCEGCGQPGGVRVREKAGERARLCLPCGQEHGYALVDLTPPGEAQRWL